MVSGTVHAEDYDAMQVRLANQRLPNIVMYLESILKTLKPGGILGITDHIGLAGRENGNLHRIDIESARDLIQRARFVMKAESSLLANPKDHHDSHVYSDAINRRTDRFVFRARKPG